jgi:hypothetical protein
MKCRKYLLNGNDMERLYYSQRNNLGKTNKKIDLAYLKELF